ncbi:MAG: S-layer homology domain-containing protein [Oscillospiraceae bacterium]|jgi:hypothetical protein|nr:S-layer homology domain-containing protein [Oscillospiraceae bacterium]
MKSKRILSVLLVLVLALALVPTTALAARTPTEWAIPEMREANLAGLLSHRAATDFQRALTRDEFCELVVTLAERALGKSLPVPINNPFLDCNSLYVLKAYGYGIVNGVDLTHFGPTETLERQQLVAMMYRAISKLSTDLSKTLLQPPAANLPFKDLASVEEYAVTPLAYAYSNNIIKGDDAGRFNPRDNMTSEECEAVIIRSFKSIETVVNNALTQAQLFEKAVANLTIGYAFGDSDNAVTQNLNLPTSTTGGATVTWSSNSNAITTAGVVNSSVTTYVTLIATVRLGSQVREKAFNVRVVNGLSGDKLLVENGTAALDVVYLISGDNAERVTGNISLPAHIYSASVTWSSNTPQVISTSGTVTVPTTNTTIPVTLTAQIRVGDETRNKTFVLNVMNPEFATSRVSLHNVELGMTQTQVAAVLGTSPRDTFSTATNESWAIYYTNSYVNLIAVAYQSSKVVAVYSQSTDWANQLRDSSNKTVITTDKVNTVKNAAATVYTDPSNNNAKYAVLLSDTTTNISAARALTAEGTEKLTLALLNGYRAQSGRTDPLLLNTKLSTASRSYSTNYGTGDFRAMLAQAEYDYTLTIGEPFAHEGTGAPDFLNNIVQNTTLRTYYLATTARVAGIGYYGYTYGGNYRNMLTLSLGSLIGVTNITYLPTTVSVAVGANVTVALSVTPTTRNEPIVVRVADPTIATISGADNTGVYIIPVYNSTATLNIQIIGSRSGTTTVNVSGLYSGIGVQIPLTVGATYASSVLIADANGNTAVRNHTIALGTTLQLRAITVPADAATGVNWVINEPNAIAAGVTVTNGLIYVPASFPVAQIPYFTITAWAPSDQYHYTLTGATATTAKDTVSVAIGNTQYPTDATLTLSTPGLHLFETKDIVITPIGGGYSIPNVINLTSNSTAVSVVKVGNTWQVTGTAITTYVTLTGYLQIGPGASDYRVVTLIIPAVEAPIIPVATVYLTATSINTQPTTPVILTLPPALTGATVVWKNSGDYYFNAVQTSATSYQVTGLADGNTGTIWAEISYNGVTFNSQSAPVIVNGFNTVPYGG